MNTITCAENTIHMEAFCVPKRFRNNHLTVYNFRCHFIVFIKFSTFKSKNISVNV